MPDSKSYILFLPSWFPSSNNVHNGDFIFRHSMAVSKFYSIYLINIYRSNNKNLIGHEFYNLNSDSTFCNYGYFNNFKSSIINIVKYFYFYYREIKTAFKHGKPKLVHVHVSFRAGIIALFLKLFFGIPYIITEHWTIFTKERTSDYHNLNFFNRLILKFIFRYSEFVLPVSENLEFNLRTYYPLIRTKVIPNVVNPSLFYFDFNYYCTDFNFIHVSSANPIKNHGKIITSFLKLRIKYSSIKLKIVGLEYRDLIHWDSKQLMDGGIEICGKLSHSRVAFEMRKVNAFVLFSDYETQSCVSIEALCCGVPVISSRLPCLEEFITEDNGILVPPGDEDALYNAMESMILNYKKYDRQKISETAQAKYDPDVVGKQIVEVYKKVLSKK